MGGVNFEKRKGEKPTGLKVIFARDNGSRRLGRVWDFSKLLVYPTTPLQKALGRERGWLKCRLPVWRLSRTLTTCTCFPGPRTSSTWHTPTRGRCCPDFIKENKNWKTNKKRKFAKLWQIFIETHSWLFYYDNLILKYIWCQNGSLGTMRSFLLFGLKWCSLLK